MAVTDPEVAPPVMLMAFADRMKVIVWYLVETSEGFSTVCSETAQVSLNVWPSCIQSSAESGAL